MSNSLVNRSGKNQTFRGTYLMDSTIILPTYNGGEYIINQLKSIEATSPRNTLVKILDDYSKDNTLDLLENYISGTSLNIQFDRNNSNIGPNQSFIKLLKSVRTENVIFCDQDDIWVNDRVSATNLSQSDVLISKFSPFEDFFSKDILPVLPSKVPNMINTFFKPSFPGCCLSGKTKIFLGVLKNDDLRTIYDWFLTTELVLRGNSFSLTEDRMFYK